MKKLASWLGALGLGCASVAWASPPPSPLMQINQIREMAGMTPFAEEVTLQKAALGHVRYLEKNQLLAHTQEEVMPEFSGTTPGERALRAGFASRLVTENLSAGQADVSRSVESLMGAIYHRFGFLNFQMNLLGFAQGQQATYVYLMGNQAMAMACQEREVLPPQRYMEACSPGVRVPLSQYESILREQALKNPMAVLWPSRGSRVVPPTYSGEVPDPIPDKTLTGYPISIQLNPELISQPTLLSFRLFHGTTGEEVQPVRILTAHTDPNQRLSPYEFALFPLERLDWGQSYRVEAEIETKEKRFELLWEFSTKPSPHPLIQVQGKGEYFSIRSGRTYNFYIPPKLHQPLAKDVRIHHNGPVEVSWEDPNTLELRATGQPCERIRIAFSEVDYFFVQLAPQENLRPAAAPSAQCPH